MRTLLASVIMLGLAAGAEAAGPGAGPGKGAGNRPAVVKPAGAGKVGTPLKPRVIVIVGGNNRRVCGPIVVGGCGVPVIPCAPVVVPTTPPEPTTPETPPETPPDPQTPPMTPGGEG